MPSIIDNANQYSTDKIAALRGELQRLRLPLAVSVVTTGSFARKEATEHSDLDFFLLVENNGMLVDEAYLAAVRHTIAGIVRRTIGKEPSVDGAFGGFEPVDRILINIGGNFDDNAKTTRRILLLLECDWLSNEKLFHDVRSRLLSRYVDNNIQKENITRFLLNDIIRYYRTVCVDFEYKTFEAQKGWGIRNVKLRFPRKLLYFSALLTVAQTAGRADKKNILEQWIGLTPIDRLKKIKSPRVKMILKEYEYYLKILSDGKKRGILEEIQKRDEGEYQLFDDLRDAAHRMSLDMMELLSEKYPKEHPIQLGIFN